MLERKKISRFVLIIIIISNIFSVPVIADASVYDYDAVEVGKIMSRTNIENLQAKSWILVDGETGSVLLKNNEHEKFPVASITKIMSMLLIMEAVDSKRVNLSDNVQVSEYAYGFGGSQVYLAPGEVFTLEEMLKAIAIHSANDATVAVAEKISGSEDAFVQLMNQRAQELNMKDTYFIDCTGLDDEGYSSAWDIAIMSRELITKHPKVIEYSARWQDTFRDGTFGLDNRNKLIRYYEGATGLKTGFTRKAGHCLAATAERSGMHLISVVLGEPDSNTRFAESQKLLNYGFANFETVTVDKKGTVIQELEVKKGLEKKVNVVINDDVTLLLYKGDKEKVNREVNLPENIEAPVEKGQKVGEIKYVIENIENPIQTVDLITEANVEKASFIRLFFRMVLEWFGIGRD